MPTVLRASHLFDGTRLRAGPVLTMDGGRIASVSFGGPVPTDAVDLTGTTLLPGLIDTHVHLAFDASADPVAALAGRDDDDDALAAMRAAAATAVRGGITTVRDLGDRGYLSLRLRSSEEPGPLPTILAAGPPITTPGGHCHYLGGETEPTPAAMRAAVRERAERGVDVVKIMASGGTLTPGTKQEWPQFEVAELKAAVAQAHGLGLPVVAHVHATRAVRNVVEAGVDGIEHVSFWSATGVDPPPPDLVRTIVARRLVVGATLGAVPGGGAVAPSVAPRLPAIIENLLLLHRSGARMVLSSDAGIAPVKPHDVLRHSIVRMGALGLPPAEVLRMVTTAAAEACGMAGRKGALTPGHDADILAIDGDPLADLSAIHRIRAVYAGGVAVR